MELADWLNEAVMKEHFTHLNSKINTITKLPLVSSHFLSSCGKFNLQFKVSQMAEVNLTFNIYFRNPFYSLRLSGFMGEVRGKFTVTFIMKKVSNYMVMLTKTTFTKN